MAFLPLIFSAGSALVSLISSIAIFFTIKQWVTMALVAVVGIAMIKMGTAILEFLKSVASSSVGRYILGAIVIFVLGLGVGYCSKSGQPSIEKDKNIKHIEMKSKKFKLDGTAIVIEGKVYYPADFINGILSKNGIKGGLKGTYP